jgi:competence protein ComEC
VIAENTREHNLNNSSVVCKLECGAKSFLFTGDLEREGEEELLAAGAPLASSVLKVGHHGGKNSSSRRFIEAVRPELAVIPADYPMARGSPSREVLERLESAGVRIFWTGRDGAVIIDTDGINLTVKTGRRSKARAGSAP